MLVRDLDTRTLWVILHSIKRVSALCVFLFLLSGGQMLDTGGKHTLTKVRAQEMAGDNS